MSGVCIIKSGTASIAINENHHPNRQRFSLAHEIGHFVLHRERTDVTSFIDSHGNRSKRLMRDGRSALGTEPLEVEANTFAAELLMPADSVENTFKRLVPGRFFEDDDIASMARRFGVSQFAMTIRLKALDLI